MCRGVVVLRPLEMHAAFGLPDRPECGEEVQTR